MLATFKFIKRTGDGYFGRVDYVDVVCPNIEVRDLNHIIIKARATFRKHLAGWNSNSCYMSYCFVTLQDTGEVYRVSCDTHYNTQIDVDWSPVVYDNSI